jgi:hypothetical protein
MVPRSCLDDVFNQSIHHCRHRSVCQKKLYDQPMMRAVLAEMVLEVEVLSHSSCAFAARPTLPRKIRTRWLMRACSRRWRNTGSAGSHRRSFARLWSASMATP